MHASYSFPRNVKNEKKVLHIFDFSFAYAFNIIYCHQHTLF